MEDIGSVHFRLQRPGKPDDIQLIRANVQIDGSTIFVYFYAADDDWPFSIENDSDYPVSFCQTVSVMLLKPFPQAAHVM